jgi:hypothetical protein
LSIENVLNNLRKVKKTGPNKWQACCPAHDDKSPSLAIKDDNGKILLHCFGGCGVMDVLGAIGLEPMELFPPGDGTWRPDETGRVAQSKFTAIDALRALGYVGGQLAIFAADMAEGKVLSSKERDQLGVACSRIAAALEYLGDN